MNLRPAWWLPLALSFALVAPGCAPSSPPSASSPSSTSTPPAPPAERFASPEVAVESLVAALRDNDDARLKKILGPAGDRILWSGDELADRADVARFLSLYDESHRVQPDAGGAAGTRTLLVGKQDWPFPVPIVKSGSGTGSAYVFDAEAGEEEVLNRRIGRNELDVEQVCLAITDAQREYVRLNPTGATLPEYARKLVSDPGTKNGLYWPTAEGEPESPLGALVAAAAAEGYRAGTTRPTERAYHGYVYRLLTAQGPHATAGALDYVVDGHLIGGFAVVACPAQYGNSGIMTFITNHEGVIYQRDLGPDTQRIAQSLTRFDPGPEWTVAGDSSQLTQSE
jgi:hypothetical protein